MWRKGGRGSRVQYVGTGTGQVQSYVQFLGEHTSMRKSADTKVAKMYWILRKTSRLFIIIFFIRQISHTGMYST